MRQNCAPFALSLATDFNELSLSCWRVLSFEVQLPKIYSKTFVIFSFRIYWCQFVCLRIHSAKPNVFQLYGTLKGEGESLDLKYLSKTFKFKNCWNGKKRNILNTSWGSCFSLNLDRDIDSLHDFQYSKTKIQASVFKRFINKTYKILIVGHMVPKDQGWIYNKRQCDMDVI